jgi:hypothetical protein
MDFTRKGSGSVCARSTPSADSSSAAAVHEFNERSSLGGGAVSVMPESANSSSTTSPSWRAPIGDRGFQSPELLNAAWARGSTPAKSRPIRYARSEVFITRA